MVRKDDGVAGIFQFWCDLPEEVPKTIDAMIAADEIRPEERERCVFWEWAAFAPRAHEAALEVKENA